MIMFPFTSMLPPTETFEPTLKIVPDELSVFAEAIFPPITLLFASNTVPPLYIFPVTVKLPDEVTDVIAPTAPPLKEEEVPI